MDAIFNDPPAPKDGFLHMGDKTGLGLELNEAAMKKFAVA